MTPQTEAPLMTADEPRPPRDDVPLLPFVPSPAPPARRRRAPSWLATAVVAVTVGVVAGGGAGAGAASLLAASAPAGQAASAANARQASVTTTTTDQSSAVIAAVDAIGPAVVVIETQASGAFGAASGIGSGFIYDARGYILTNNHVISGAGSITVTLADGRTFVGRVIAVDAASDLAVVKIDASGLPVAAIGSSSGLRVGQPVIAIGDPLGEFANTVTTGIISGLDRSITAGSSPRSSERLAGLIQTDAAINSGNSGGPLVDAAGRVVGIATAAASSAQGLGFAIPIDAARNLMSSAIGATA